ncbi:chromosome partitioning protein ParB [Candidatus Termititenax dinenymphae]|uniref:Chromosome partitioning protein ParB n=1 Tax=Candidatus Termititenax dinenymphae TaxID=2218523 RepID=A0A388TKZ5_9BACT|nr:chromosome partitioning protein ParB [Candidatus Termititenax dinenymphae]
MALNNKGLGDGLNRLLHSTTGAAEKEVATVAATLSKNDKITPLFGRTIVSIQLKELIPNPLQPRKYFDDEALADLASSIKVHGVIQPLIVRKKDDKYEIVAGERRWRAAKRAGLDSVPALIKSFSDEISLEQAIIENTQRENLNAIEEAESYTLLMQNFGLTQEQVAEKVGKARSSIANILRLNDLPREVKDSLRNNEISAGHARAILAAGNVVEQLNIWRKVVHNNLNVRDTESLTTGKNGKSKDKHETTEKSADLTNMEQKLMAKFATKVDISGTEQRGSITIRYFSRDDLERLYTLLLTNEVI